MSTDDLTLFQTEARLVAEIATRLLEWEELCGRSRVVTWVTRCASLSEEGGTPLHEYLRIQTGNTALISQSFGKRAASRNVCRQAVHKGHHCAVGRIEQTMPEVAWAINELTSVYHAGGSTGDDRKLTDGFDYGDQGEA